MVLQASAVFSLALSLGCLTMSFIKGRSLLWLGWAFFATILSVYYTGWLILGAVIAALACLIATMVTLEASPRAGISRSATQLSNPALLA